MSLNEPTTVMRRPRRLYSATIIYADGLEAPTVLTARFLRNSFTIPVVIDEYSIEMRFWPPRRYDTVNFRATTLINHKRFVIRGNAILIHYSELRPGLIVSATRARIEKIIRSLELDREPVVIPERSGDSLYGVYFADANDAFVGRLAF